MRSDILRDEEANNGADTRALEASALPDEVSSPADTWDGEGDRSRRLATEGRMLPLQLTPPAPAPSPSMDWEAAPGTTQGLAGATN